MTCDQVMVVDEWSFQEYQEKEGWSDDDDEENAELSDQASLSFSKFQVYHLSFFRLECWPVMT